MTILQRLALGWGRVIWWWRGRPRGRKLIRKRCPQCGRRIRPAIAKHYRLGVPICDKCLRQQIGPLGVGRL